MSTIGKNRVSPEPLDDAEDVEHVDLPETLSPRKLPQQTSQGWEDEQTTPSPGEKDGGEGGEGAAFSNQDSPSSSRQEDQHQPEDPEPSAGEQETSFFERTEFSKQLADDEDKQTTDLQFRTTRFQDPSETPPSWPDQPPGSPEGPREDQGDPHYSVHHEPDDRLEEKRVPDAQVLYTAGGLSRGVEDVRPVQPSPVQSPAERLVEEPGPSSSSHRPGHKKPDEVQDFTSGGDKEEGGGCCSIILTVFSYFLVIIFFPFSLIVCIKVVQEYERAVIFRLGRLAAGGAKGPGIFFVLPCIEDYTKVDLRTVTFDIPPQEVLTRDSVTVSVDAVVYYRIYNPTVSVANVANAAHSTQLLAQTTLRNVLGTKNLGEILSDRDQISDSMQTALDDATDRWGIKVERVEIKDVRLPIQLQRAMAAEAEAAREARAKVIAAEGEQKASRALKEAAEIITESPAALQLRYLQTLNSISAEKNSTIIFPLPIDMLKSFIK